MNAVGVRNAWLRPRALPARFTRLAPELPLPALASERATPIVHDYLAWWIAHPDPGGQFAARTAVLQSLPPDVQQQQLFSHGYDGLIYEDGAAVIGHVFFQRHGNAMHAFSIALSDDRSGRGVSVVMSLDFLSYSSIQPGVERVRLGSGRTTPPRRFLDRMEEFGPRFGWHVGVDAWLAFDRSPTAEPARTPREEIFRNIHANNLWGDCESASGPGSTGARTAAFRDQLPPLFASLGVRTLLDAPCGDFNWMRHVPIARYVGVDIVSEIVAANQRTYASACRYFLHGDLVADPLPRADAILCRDGLVHLSWADSRQALLNFKRSSAQYLVTTTFPRLDRNADISTGGWRPVNLELAPYNFPAPLRLVDEKRRAPDGSDACKCLGVWDLRDVAVGGLWQEPSK
jgi:hypothetical protein